MKNHIATLRKEYKMTQEELAQQVGVSRQTIISIEKGKYTASLPLAHAIAQFFHRTIEDVFIFEEDVL